MRPSLIALFALALLASAGRAYDLAETDGDDTPGNAPILLGWRSSDFPLQFGIDPNPPTVASAGAFAQAVRDSWGAWATASQGDVSFAEVSVPGGTVTTAVLNATLAIGDCSTPSNCTHLVATIQSGWAARTSSTTDTIALTFLKFDTTARRLVDADILINNETHSFATSGDVTRFDVQGVITHEFGHVLGIAHPANSSRGSSTMFPSTATPGTALRTLETDDVNAVRYLYAALTIFVPGPDTNTIGLLARAANTGSSGGGGGCRAVSDAATPFTAGFAAVLLLVPFFRRRS